MNNPSFLYLCAGGSALVVAWLLPPDLARIPFCIAIIFACFLLLHTSGIPFTESES